MLRPPGPDADTPTTLPWQAALRPLRLQPGHDLRQSLEVWAAAEMPGGGFVVCAIGSLVDARLRLADQRDEILVQGPLELLTLAGSLSPDGAHLHAAVADAQGQVVGGHLGHGCVIRTTAEVLVCGVPGWQLGRAQDAGTGFKELVVWPVADRG